MKIRICSTCEGSGWVKDGGERIGINEWEDAPCTNCDQTGRVIVSSCSFDFEVPFGRPELIGNLYDIDSKMHGLARELKRKLTEDKSKEKDGK